MKLQDLKAGDLFQFKRQSHGIIYEVLRESGPRHEGDRYQAVGVFVEGRPSWIFPPRKVTQDGNPAPDVRKVNALPRALQEADSGLEKAGSRCPAPGAPCGGSAASKTKGRAMRASGRRKQNLRGAKRVTVTMVEVLEGEGTPQNPFRIVTTYFDDDGNLLASSDAQPTKTETRVEEG